MPSQPTAGDIHVNVPLSNIAVAYQQRQQDFIADQVFPNVPVDFMSNVYYKYGKGEWFKTNARDRAPATESAGTGWSITTDSYRATVKAVHKDIADQDRANQDSPSINLDRDATLFVTRDLMLRRELDWVAKYFGTGIWANTDQTGVASAPSANQFVQWNNSSSTPIEDITAQIVGMAEKTGYRPNTLAIGPRVWEKLRNHAEFLDRIKYTQKGIVTTDLLAAALDIDRVLIPYTVQNTAADGAADSFSFGYGKGALLVYANPEPGILQPSAGYTFSWSGYLGASALGSRIKRFRMEQTASDRVEGEMAYDMKVVATDLGVFFTSAVA